MKIVLTGGTGFVGRALASRLVAEKHSLVLLTRNPSATRDLTSGFLKLEQWDGKAIGPWARQIDGSDGVINLAGESVGIGRWTKARKVRIINSRVDATRAIVAAIAQAKKKPRVLVNAGGVGYYGNVESGDVLESHPRGTDFLAELSARWEGEATAAEAFGVRVVRLRMGIVLEKNGGALKKMLLPFKLFVGGTIGSGRQWLPWTHRNDVLNIILFALQNPTISGPLNVAAPEAVTMKQFCKALGRAMHRPSWAPVPAFVLKIALGEMSDMLLTGQRVVPLKLQEAGYKFLYPRLDEALAAILK